MKTIKVGLGTCGVSAGGEKVYTALKDEIARENIQVRLWKPGAWAIATRRSWSRSSTNRDAATCTAM